MPGPQGVKRAPRGDSGPAGPPFAAADCPERDASRDEPGDDPGDEHPGGSAS